MSSIAEANQEIDSLGALILANEDWAKGYTLNPDSFAKLIKLEVKIERLVRTHFANLAKERMNNYINWGQYDTKLVKAYKLDVIVDVQELRDEEPDELFRVMHEPILTGMALGATTAEVQYNIELGMNKYSDTLMKAAEKYTGFLVKNVSDTTIDRIKSSISTSLKLSEDQAAAAARLEKVVLDPKRAAMIARTEAVRSYSKGVLEFGRSAGYTKKAWEISSDPCETCAANEGAVVGIDEEYPSGDDSAPAHPNCRCGDSLVPDTEDDEQ